MKPLQQYCHMVLFIEYVVLTRESVDEILWCYHSNETSSTVLSHGAFESVDEILWCYHSNETSSAVLSHGAFESVDETLWCYHSNKTSSAVLSHGAIYLVCSTNFWVCGWNPKVWPFKWNLFSSTFTWCFWVCGWNPMVLPFKWNLFSSTFTWYCLFISMFKMKFGHFVILAIFGAKG